LIYFLKDFYRDVGPAGIEEGKSLVLRKLIHACYTPRHHKFPGERGGERQRVDDRATRRAAFHSLALAATQTNNQKM